MIDNILNKIKDKKPNSKLSIVLRHPKREEITDLLNSIDVPLVDEGREMARELGRNLPKRYSYNIYHSYVPRCIETAELIFSEIIKSGIDNKSRISGQRDYLYGFFLLDLDYMLNIANEVGDEKFILRWFEDQFESDKIIPFQETSTILLKHILDAEDKNNFDEINLFITHDWVMIPLICRIVEYTDPNFTWPRYFEVISIEKTKEKSIKISFKHFSKNIEII